ncbi:MAG: SirB2 family protein [Pseudomonadales bacterium]|jgi:uncharacterized membrane protein SirB2|nr:SirB2 family protein [Pseudomonadales bacterium]
MYGFWYALHVGCVVLSIAGFLLRGAWMLIDSPLRTTRPARVLPHVVDSFLLVGALGLAATLGAWPFAQPWLTAKVLALLAYIGLGMVAFRFGRTKRVRASAFVVAVAVLAYLVAVALTKDPLPP